LSLKEIFKNNKIRYSFYILLAQGIFLLCNLYVNHWITINWDIEGFATYNLIKRIASFIAFPLLIGAGIGIPRYISFLKGHVQRQSYEYLISGLLLFVSSFIFFSGLAFLFPSLILEAFDQSASHSDEVLVCILVFVLSQGLYILLNSYYRGRVQIGLMSLLNIVIMSILPLFILFAVQDVFVYFYYYSFFTLIITLGIILVLGLKTTIFRNRIRNKTIRLFKYGYPRIIADLGLFSLEFMPIFLTSLYIGLAESGYLSMIFILLKLASMLYELVGSLILPYFGKIFKNEPTAVFISKVNTLLTLGLALSVVITICLYFLIPIIITQFFPSLHKAIFPAQLVFIAFPIYSVYLLLRNILDVIVVKAFNSINLSIVLVIQILILASGFYFKNFIVYTVLSIVVPYFVLGLLTYWIWTNMKKILKNG